MVCRVMGMGMAMGTVMAMRAGSAGLSVLRKGDHRPAVSGKARRWGGGKRGTD